MRTGTILPILIASSGIMLTSCVSTVSELGLTEVVSNIENDMSVFYKGRKNGYDYFHVIWRDDNTPLRDKEYRLTAPNRITKTPIPFSPKNSDWIICSPDLDNWFAK